MGKNDFDDEDYSPHPGQSESRRSETRGGSRQNFGGVFGTFLAAVFCICAAVILVGLIRTANVANQGVDISKNGANQKPLEVARPGVPIGFEDISITIKEILVDKVLLVDWRGNIAISQDVCTKIVLEIQNNSDTRKIDYRTWRGHVLYSCGLKDNLGNSYKGIEFGLTKIIDAIEDSKSIHPGEKIVDILVFERPVDKATIFTLELNKTNVRAAEDLKVQINKSDFRSFKSP